MSLVLEQLGRGYCGGCNKIFLLEVLKENGGRCKPCHKRHLKDLIEEKKYQEYLKTPEYKEERKKEEEAIEAQREIERKDIEANFYWFEGRCKYCLGHTGEFINNLVLRPNADNLYCGDCGRKSRFFF